MYQTSDSVIGVSVRCSVPWLELVLVNPVLDISLAWEIPDLSGSFDGLDESDNLSDELLVDWVLFAFDHHCSHASLGFVSELFK